MNTAPATTEADTIQPGERTELRRLVRLRIRLLRSQIADQHATQMSQIDTRVAAKFQEDRAKADELRTKLDRIVTRANRQAEALLANYPDIAEPRAHMFSRPWITRPDQGRDKLRKAMVAAVTAQTEQAKLRIATLEAELLSTLALNALKTVAAQNFVAAIPEIGDLMPERLTAIESAFDAEQKRATLPEHTPHKQGETPHDQ